MDIRIIESSVLRECIYHRNVAGLPVYVLVKPGYSKKFASYATNFGSVDTCFIDPRTSQQVRVPDGIAHFLEHKMFESDNDSVMQEFSRIGASSNAYTDYSTTSYVFSTSQEFEKALDLLIGFVENPRFTDKGVEKEKPIIEQELRMYEDMPSVQVETNLMEALYHNSPVRVEIGGTVESIKKITRRELNLCYETFYAPSNMVLFVAGDIEPEAVFGNVADSRQRSLEARTRGVVAENARGLAPTIGRIYPEEPPSVVKPVIEKSMSVALPLVLIGLKDDVRAISGKDLLRRQAIGDILFSILFGRSSEAYERLYTERLVSEKFSAGFDAEQTYVHAVIGGESPDPDGLVTEVKETLMEARDKGIPADRVEKLRRKSLGEFVMLFNSMEYVSRVFTSVLFKNAMIFDYYDALQALTKEDVEDLLRGLISPDRMAVSVVRPR